MKVLPLLLVLPGLALGVVDQYVDCLDGIYTAISYLTFSGTDATDYYGTACTNKVVVTSMWAAAKMYCTPKQIDLGYKQLDKQCEEYGSVALTPYSEVLPTLTDQYIKSLPVAQYSDIKAGTIFNTSVLISRSLYKAGRDTYVIFDEEYALHKRYGWAVYGFWGGLLLIGMINRLVTHFSVARRMKNATDVEVGNASTNSKGNRTGPIALFKSIHYWLRAHVIIPAAFGTHHNRPFYWNTIPTRMETIIVVAFWVMTFILCCVTYHIFSPNLYYTEAIQTWRYISDRTGIMCYATLPWLWMFSGRNNIFLWLTGWSFSTFNIFHRHIARCATVLAIVHSIGWSAIEANFGYFAESWKEQYWYMGGMATIAMSLLVFFSFMWFRVRSYEVFLLIHIALSVVTLVGLFYHTNIFSDHEYNPYLWPPVAIWGFDRVARLVRWAYCNLHVKFSRSIVGTKATATYYKDGNFLRVEIVPGSRLLKPGPGQHYFLYQPLKWKGWENHPFTLSSYETIGDANGLVTAGAHAERNTDDIASTEKRDPVSSAGPSSSTPSDEESISSQHKRSIFGDAVGRQKLTFLVRPFGSWTRRLHEECLKSPTGVIQPALFIEGPYGERSPLHAYENVVFIVGGTGISGAVPYIHEHIGRTYLNAKDGQPSTRTRDITLIWSAKQSGMIRNVAEHELKPILGRKDVHTYLHATSGEEVPGKFDTNEKIDAVADKEIMKTSSASTRNELNITHGRPNIREMVLSVVEDVHNAGAAGGRVAILACGPAGMADEARAAVHIALKQGKREVEYIEETFGW